MRSKSCIRNTGACLVGAVMAMLSGIVRAEDIVVSNYGVSANGMPYAVAMAKGYFKEEGANVTGILTSAGGERRCATCWQAMRLTPK